MPVCKRAFFIIMVFFILFLVAVVFLIHLFKVPKFGSVTLVTGAVKSGKTGFTLYSAYRTYRRVWRLWIIRCILCFIFRKKLPEEPLFYSNVPLMNIRYVPVTSDLVLRKCRLNYKSVVFISESSLLADQYSFEDPIIRESNGLWNKLYGHMSRGGYLFYETQSVKDNPFTLKNNITSYFSIHHKVRLPFFSIVFLRELAYSSDEGAGIRNTFDQDIEKSLLPVVMPNSIFKMYDSYTYSVMTDDLPVLCDQKFIKKSNDRSMLKSRRFPSFRKFKTINNV